MNYELSAFEGKKVLASDFPRGDMKGMSTMFMFIAEEADIVESDIMQKKISNSSQTDFPAHTITYTKCTIAYFITVPFSLRWNVCISTNIIKTQH